MKFLMHIGFDISSRFDRNVYYFQYKKIRFKLIQNKRKWKNVLLTLLDHPVDENYKQQVYSVASEYISALSWQNRTRATVQPLGGNSEPDDVTLKNTRCRAFHFPKIPYYGQMTGAYINRIPEIETEHQKNALIFFREADSSNSNYLAFLFFWQVMTIEGNNPITWVNNTFANQKNRLMFFDDEIARLELGNRDIGDYLNEDCRNCIAHLIRRPGRRQIALDYFDDMMRIGISTNIVKEFARFYIQHELNLQNELYLVRKNGRRFPTYVKEASLYKYHYTHFAYR